MMKHIFLFVSLFLSPVLLFAQHTLTEEQKQKAENAVKTYFDRLSRYAAQPMSPEALDLRNDIVLMFDNMLETPVYNDLERLETQTGVGIACMLDEYLLSFGSLYSHDKEHYSFLITCDSIVCQPLVEPNFNNTLNALVYVRKHIQGCGISETLTNVIRYNLNTDKMSYIEKASFTTNAEDIDFLLKNHYGYNTSKLNEMAARCFQEKKYKQAYDLYEQAAIRDDMDAQYALANMLWKRQGCSEYGLFATINMTKFWLKKIYFKYIEAQGVRIYEIGLYRPVNEMINIVFHDEPEFFSDAEDKPFNSNLMKYKIPGKDLYGFIDMKGDVVIPAIYGGAHAFSDGLAAVCKNNKWGYINTKGEIVIPIQYDNYNTSSFINGTASVSLTDTIDGTLHKRFFIINKKGEQISEDFDFIRQRWRKEEMIMPAQRGDKWGFINGVGKIKIPFIYDNYHGILALANTATDHYTAICQNGKWGFIDTSSSEGRIIVPPQYEKVGNFCFGMVWVMDNESISFIDKTGNIVCGGYVYVTPFNASGLSCVKTSRNTTEAYLINKRGEIVFYCDKDEKGNLRNIRRYK